MSEVLEGGEDAEDDDAEVEHEEFCGVGERVRRWVLEPPRCMIGRPSAPVAPGPGLEERERMVVSLSLATACTGEGRKIGFGEPVLTRKLLRPASVGLIGGVPLSDLGESPLPLLPFPFPFTLPLNG